MAIWRCPQCNDGVRGPERPRRSNICRYCLTCSKTAGVLVERVSPKQERLRAQRHEQRVDARRRAAERRAERRAALKPLRDARRRLETYIEDGMLITAETNRIWNILRKHHGASGPAPKVQRTLHHLEVDDLGTTLTGTNGSYAHTGRGFITLGGGARWETLAHELVHMADRRLGVRFLGDRKRHHDEWFYKTLKDVCERRWKVRISFAEVTRWGYAVDAIIQRQINPIVKAEVERRRTVKAACPSGDGR